MYHASCHVSHGASHLTLAIAQGVRYYGVFPFCRQKNGSTEDSNDYPKIYSFSILVDFLCMITNLSHIQMH